ncbi:hypothetical protein FE36_12165 [Xanthomonas oryzae pv. oryzicola]|uniref:hypothetical protein n=1 Tax=Xanthomonas oryzae TaxID=347 RepID=UPI000642CE28|nr:hypothetical protein [Xanthomonas oryzae]AKK64530.1 hypothetical protein FE36_12165 [Xanthomonas oryzae pv. oryzicola]AKO12782.1 hypothetical protein ACU14_13100 [Xanthomonas oryzae pv. oryzicola]RBI38629.1 hypothetical protein BRL69_14755 [Xanthomonas oryzae pv. oryzae]RBI46273.1 hypothetical protein BRL99_14155 [Xanthomonas oryzae pv. oryzae]
MRNTLDWAALPPTAKLCLQVALLHDGLLQTEHGYIGCNAPADTQERFGAVVVAQLMQQGLVTADSLDERRVALTDAAVALFYMNTPQTGVEA